MDDRVRGPTWSKDWARSITPNLLTLPQVGLSPTVPQTAEGWRIDPPVSVPIVPKAIPDAVAHPEPLEEAPDQ